MADEAKKKVIELEVYGQGDEMKYKGRLLGLLSPEEYAGVIKKKDLRGKLFTVATTPTADIAKLIDVEGLRLAMVVKEKNEETVAKKTLFFTEQLDMVSHVVGDDDITFVGKEGSYILLTEVENG